MHPAAQRGPDRAAAPPAALALEKARAQLGGPLGDAAPLPGIGPGTIVAFVEHTDSQAGGADASSVGVVLFASVDEVLVMLDARRMRKLAPSAMTAKNLPAPDALAAIASDARIFGALHEGERVRFAAGGGGARGEHELDDGKLIAKCRYGGLVARDDGTIVALGFRKLWPAARTAST